MKEIEGLSWIQEVITERFDQSIINAMTENSLIFGGALRDIVAGVPLCGDLDIVVPQDESIALLTALHSSPKWSKHPKGKVINPPKQKTKKAATFTSSSHSYAFRQAYTTRSDFITSGPSAGGLSPRNATAEEDAIEPETENENAIGYNADIHMPVIDRGNVLGDQIDMTETVPDRAVGIAIPDPDPREVVQEAENPTIQETNRAEPVLVGEPMPEGHVTPARMDEYIEGIQVVVEPPQEIRLQEEALPVDPSSVVRTYTPIVKKLPPCLKAKLGYGKSALDIKTITTYESSYGRKVQIISIEGRIGPLNSEYKIEDSISAVRKVDIICCGLAMNKKGTIFEVVEGAYEDCKNKTLRFNRITIEVTDLENLKKRIKKLKDRGWKSEIDIEDIEKKYKRIVTIKRKRRKKKEEKEERKALLEQRLEQLEAKKHGTGRKKPSKKTKISSKEQEHKKMLTTMFGEIR